MKKRGGKRTGAGRKPRGGLAREQVQVWMASELAAWLRSLGSVRGETIELVLSDYRLSKEAENAGVETKKG